jgi:hypothetical protein
MDERAAIRVAATELIIEHDARKHEERGESHRADGFFDHRGGIRPEAEDLFEGILMTAAQTWQEAKLPLLARLFDSVAHDASVDPETAMFLAKTADQLTYRQLQGLAVFGRHQEHEIALAAANVRKAEGEPPDPGFAHEFDNLGDRGLVGVGGSEDGVVRNPSELMGWVPAG